MTVEKGMGKKKAIAAIARQLGVLLWRLLKEGTRYEVRHFRAGRPEVKALAQEALGA
jgi:hypothetical protein